LIKENGMSGEDLDFAETVQKMNNDEFLKRIENLKKQIATFGTKYKQLKKQLSEKDREIVRLREISQSLLKRLK